MQIDTLNQRLKAFLGHSYRIGRGLQIRGHKFADIVRGEHDRLKQISPRDLDFCQFTPGLKSKEPTVGRPEEWRYYAVGFYSCRVAIGKDPDR